MKLWAFLGAVNALAAVAAGAFGAHGLKARVSPELLVVFETGARYHMYHALGLWFVAWLASRGASHMNVAGSAMMAGILFFSGSLYVMALTKARWLGAITPIGGVGFMIGWAVLAWGALRLR